MPDRGRPRAQANVHKCMAPSDLDPAASLCTCSVLHGGRTPIHGRDPQHNQCTPAGCVEQVGNSPWVAQLPPRGGPRQAGPVPTPAARLPSFVPCTLGNRNVRFQCVRPGCFLFLDCVGRSGWAKVQCECKVPPKELGVPEDQVRRNALYRSTCQTPVQLHQD